MKRTNMLVAAAFLALAACENKPADKPEDPTSKNASTTGASATVAATAVAPTPPTIAEGDLSTPADFEETAEKAISKANYKAELASLETEIAKD